MSIKVLLFFLIIFSVFSLLYFYFPEIVWAGVGTDAGRGELETAASGEAGRIAGVFFCGGSEVAPMMTNNASRTVTVPLVLGWRRHQSQGTPKKAHCTPLLVALT